MAQKRMFDIEIIKTDNFIDLPAESKALYFILGLEADDEGFVNPKIPMRVHLISADSLKVLIAKNLVIPFDSGVVVITDWNRNNWLDKRRIKSTQFIAEKSLLTLDNQNRYMLSNGLANAKRPLRQSRVEENSIEENSIVKGSSATSNEVVPTKTKRFVKPTVEEITAYCKERNNNIDPHRFYDSYESKGWIVGKSPMKDWKACVRTWERNNFQTKPKGAMSIDII